MIEIIVLSFIHSRGYRYFLVYDFKHTYIRGSCLGIYINQNQTKNYLLKRDSDLQLEEVLL